MALLLLPAFSAPQPGREAPAPALRWVLIERLNELAPEELGILRHFDPSPQRSFWR